MNHLEQEQDAEKAALIAWMQEQREHVVGILDGLSEADLRRPILPSGWSCLEMVQHLAGGIECFWYRAVVAGEPDVIASVTTDESSGWQVPADVPAEAIFARYRAERARTNAIIAATPLSAPPAWWPDFFGEWRLRTVRDIILHTMTETACHAGHLDAARELIDGRQWLVLPD